MIKFCGKFAGLLSFGFGIIKGVIKIKLDVLFLVFCVLLMCPSAALAYLDPSAGNALVYVALTLVSVAAYALKGIYYRLMGKSTNKYETANDIVIFSEGKNYWNTFEPIVQALISRGQSFSYYTMDAEDPGLQIKSKLVHNRFLGGGYISDSKLSRVECKIMLSTTPNIGVEGYPIKKPAKTKFLLHVFHDPEGIAYYKKNSLDFYDGVCTVSDYVKPRIRYLEKLRNLPEKELVSLGLPYWDILLKNYHESEPHERKIVLLAPSWGDKGFLSFYDVKAIVDALSPDFDIILRPHPQSWKSEPELLSRIKTLLGNYSNVTWDENPDPSQSLAKSDVMISDTSAIRVDYAVIYKKPVISLKVKGENLSSFEYSDLPEEMRSSLVEKISLSIGPEEVKNINEIVKQALAKKSETNDFIEKNIVNLGSAGEHIADYLIKKAKEV